MALDFELKLIMPGDSAAIFCRSTLEATRYLIKKRMPGVAIQIAKTLSGEPLPLNEELNGSIYQQAFFIDLPPEQVWEIIEVLSLTSQNKHNSPTPGLVVLAKSLHKDWMDLAHSLGVVNR
jgi:hypothetical protein